MKIRSGFVSNSSSSSFLVLVADCREEGQEIPGEELKKLFDRDFDFTLATHFSHGLVKAPSSLHCRNLFKNVDINQDDEVEFLVRNDIPFKALCHYGHYHLFFKRGWDYVLKATNFGQWLETYSSEQKAAVNLTCQDGSQAIKKILTKDLIN